MKRSPWRITLSVWHALLLREAVARMFGRRAAVVWLLLEPVAGIAFMLLIFSVLRTRFVGGMDTLLWLSSGLLAFYLFRRTASQGASAVGANQALYTYRQVKPVDTVLTRCVLEGALMLVIAMLVFSALGLIGVPLQLHDPLQVMASLLGLWLLGLGWGLGVSVATELVPESANLLNLLMMPLMLISGAIFPLSAIPYPWREWLMYNPVAHGIEGVRAGISPYYHHVPELSLNYLLGFALVLVFLGLVLQRRFRSQLVSL
jgi:capsular polysaccharide transport system permease protein